MTRPSSAKSSLARRWSLVGQMCSSKQKWGVCGGACAGPRVAGMQSRSGVPEVGLQVVWWERGLVAGEEWRRSPMLLA